MNSPSSPAWLAEPRTEGEPAYLARRAREEWRAAAAARHPSAQKAHITLAQLYEERARGDRPHGTLTLRFGGRGAGAHTNI